MPIIGFQQLNQHLRNTNAPKGSLWLIHGEEFLRAQALESLLATLLPDSTDRMNYEPVAHSDEQVTVALEKVSTYSFITGPKVVAMLDCRIFDSHKTADSLVTKAKTAVSEEDMKNAGRYLVRFLSAANASLNDITGEGGTEESRRKILKIGAKEDDAWVDTVVAYCRDHGMTVPQSKAPVQMLEDAIIQGFPDNHSLVIVSDLIDRRRRLYKVIEENGTVIDCVVPEGSRQADKTVQTAVLKERMGIILQQHDKQIDPAAFQLLQEMTGFQLRQFCGNLEKLVAYIGDRVRIGPKDVTEVLNRSKVDPIFELTSAVSERNLDKALFYLKTMLSQSLHPLQILAALINQIRKLIIARDFIARPHGRTWNVTLGFNDFKRRIMPAIQVYDNELIELLSDWQKALEDSPKESDGKKKTRKQKAKKANPIGTGLYLGAGGVNPYALYKLLENASHFGLDNLTDMLKMLYEVDGRLKSGERDPELVLGRLIIGICHTPKERTP